jgi:ABC-2 type transport system permease protein
MSNVIVIPMAFLSGSFFPLSLAPAWVAKLAQALPLYHLNTGMLDVLARGASPVSVLPELAILLGFTAVTTLVAIRLFRWDET